MTTLWCRVHSFKTAHVKSEIEIKPSDKYGEKIRFDGCSKYVTTYSQEVDIKDESIYSSYTNGEV